ncbi:MAG: hypothetical protein AAGH57_05415 [Pseudomonadota bacterium]
MAGDRRLSRPDASVPDWEVPDTSYRPIPIVWFTGALVTQCALLFAVLWAFSWASGVYIVAISGVATGVIGAWTWQRGMSGASFGWRVATVIMMTSQLGLVVLAANIQDLP